MDPSLLAKAAGPGCHSSADGGAGLDVVQVQLTSTLVHIFCSCKLENRTKTIKKGQCKDMFMGQLQTFSNYFLVCGGVETDPCKCFLQNGIEPKSPYLGLPQSSNNRKICPRFCENRHEKALSNIYEDKTAHFNFTHSSWSNLVPFIFLVPNSLVFRKKTAFSK